MSSSGYLKLLTQPRKNSCLRKPLLCLTNCETLIFLLQNRMTKREVRILWKVRAPGVPPPLYLTSACTYTVSKVHRGVYGAWIYILRRILQWIKIIIYNLLLLQSYITSQNPNDRKKYQSIYSLSIKSTSWTRFFLRNPSHPPMPRNAFTPQWEELSQRK